ncbi:trypsin-1-like isoform X2 [Artemia franciscana]
MANSEVLSKTILSDSSNCFSPMCKKDSREDTKLNMFPNIVICFYLFCITGSEELSIGYSRFGKIVNPQASVQPGDFPSLVSIQQFGSFGWTHVCGGVIYNSLHILTAASCVKGVPLANITVTAGEHQLSTTDSNEQRRSVLSSSIHWLYNAKTKENDIALLKVDLSFALNNYVAVVNLPQLDEETNEGLEATLVGWGTSSFTDTLLSDVPQKTQLPILSDATCRQAYSSSEIVDSMICAGGDSSGFCQGDTGGPLYIGSSQKLVGIVSWSAGCAYPGYPGVYTEVSQYVQWLENNSK